MMNTNWLNGWLFGFATGMGLGLAVGCANEVAPTPDPCAPPTFTDAACFSPGGGVTRCPEADGSYWDKQPSGTAVHWQWGPGDPQQAVTICEVKP